MKQFLITILLLICPTLVIAQNTSSPVTELSSQAMQKVSDAKFTQVKSIQVTYNYDQLLQTRQRLSDQLSKVADMQTNLQNKLDSVNALIATMESQGAKSELPAQTVKPLKGGQVIQ
jgi:signal transduction histidine kinase